ncbi:phosphotransferase family protein [Altererythrobacter sp. RZ02]|uniref:Phosphotransferase family protein n=1 Tax=Pontixanthobacter rizhaonensis TaxID=2730337 RepID=A0A848QPQ8_9SPHN|nr:phosphotransferase [Pontixanthobacter rizhaonensis]NMW32889.1 phosphotransferase family protein [Pontixanthobacter rizhaonensis]
MESSAQTFELLLDGLQSCCTRANLGQVSDIVRLTGGATMESWKFQADGELYVLRRAPSLEFMNDRPFGHDVEAAIIRAAHSAGVSAPEVVGELAAEDGIGSGFIMRALPGTPDPKAILAMNSPAELLDEIARDLARIHGIAPARLPVAIPTLDYRQGIEGLKAQFDEAGGDRPIIALGLKWLMDNCPDPVTPVLNHGDYRMGNLLAEDGKLTGVLDWELAHFGDPHEDLAFGCMTVWRFARIDRPALGLGSLEAYFAAYKNAGGGKVDPDRFRFWLVYRTVWWALGCLQMAKYWRTGEDRMLERVVISRRTSEQELDLLMLLEEDAPEAERDRPLPDPHLTFTYTGEAWAGELAEAVSEWLVTIKDRLTGHDRFQLAVARNALGMLARGEQEGDTTIDIQAAKLVMEEGMSLNDPIWLSLLRRGALEKVAADSPKYPALAVARKKWTGKD